ncbi:MAG: hypothetical protein LBQ22_01120 [Bacteroidales bacterium]|jgi:hypothetical protein|nr:hypothetical protein [Bacteroidales bacterium]
MRIIYLYILLFFCISISSCTKEGSDAPENKDQTGHEYFPLKTGNSLIYKVTEIVIDTKSEYFDTVRYFLREVINEPFIDSEGDTAYRVELFRKYEEDASWMIHKVWSARLTDKTAEKVEENLRIVKMRFPVKLDIYWDGNIYNEFRKESSKPDSLFRITDVNYLYNSQYFDIDSCVMVRQYYSESLIHKDLEYEIYASDIGLVYKENMHINSQENISSEIPIEERPTTATIYKQELIEIEHLTH